MSPQRWQRGGMKEIYIWVSTTLWGQGRNESWSCFLLSPTVWERSDMAKKEGGRLWKVIVREDQLFVFYSPALAGNTLQRSCSVGSFLWEPFDSQWEWEWDSPISSLPRVDVLLASTFPLWRLCAGPESAPVQNYGDLGMTFDDLTS